MQVKQSTNLEYTSKPKLIVYWSRRDFRLTDNPALWHSLDSWQQLLKSQQVDFLPIFILDSAILQANPNTQSTIAPRKQIDTVSTHPQIGYPRRLFLSKCLAYFCLQFPVFALFYGQAPSVFAKLSQHFTLYLFYNEDVEPFALKRDRQVKCLVEENCGQVYSYPDQLTINPDTKNKNGDIYTVFTPFQKAVWTQFLASPVYPKVDFDQNKSFCSEQSKQILSELFPVLEDTKITEEDIEKNNLNNQKTDLTDLDFSKNESLEEKILINLVNHKIAEKPSQAQTLVDLQSKYNDYLFFWHDQKIFIQKGKVAENLNDNKNNWNFQEAYQTLQSKLWKLLDAPWTVSLTVEKSEITLKERQDANTHLFSDTNTKQTSKENVYCWTVNLDTIFQRPSYSEWSYKEEVVLQDFEQFIRKELLTYKQKRDNLDLDVSLNSRQGLGQTSKLSVALKWGLVSARFLKQRILEEYGLQKIEAQADIKHFLLELIWREFYKYLLYHKPSLLTEEFQVRFRRISFKKTDLQALLEQFSPERLREFYFQQKENKDKSKSTKNQN